MKKKIFKLNLAVTFILIVSLTSVKAQVNFTLNPNGISHIYKVVPNPALWNTSNGYGTGQGDHEGDDYYADDWNLNSGGNSDCGEDLVAGISGTVIYTKSNCSGTSACGNGYGNVVIIQSNINPEFVLKYSHLINVNVSIGSFVNVEQVIGTCGATGGTSNYCHLHLALYKNIGQNQINRLTQGLSPNGLSGGPSAYAAPFYTDATVQNCVRPSKSQLRAQNKTPNRTVLKCTKSADRYDWRWRKTSTTNWINSSHTGTSYRFVNGLLPGSSYHFQVRIRCGSTWSSWSQNKYFTTLADGCNVPDVPYINLTSCTTAKWGWASISTADYYNLWYYDGSSWQIFGTSNTNSVNLYIQHSAVHYLGVSAVCGTTDSSFTSYVILDNSHCKISETNIKEYGISIPNKISDVAPGFLPEETGKAKIMLGDNINFDGMLSILPNPTNGIIKFEYDWTEGENIKLNISDLNGKIVRQNIEINKVIDLQDLSNGIYIINGAIGENKVFQKLFINK